MAGHDLFDPAANARRAEQHVELGSQLKALTEAIELYDASTNAEPSFEASKTAPLFVPLLIRDSLPSWIDVKERLGRFFGIANMEMGEMEAGEYGVGLVARALRRTVDFEGEEAQFANAVKNLVRLVQIELPDEQQAKPADAVQLPVVQGAQQPPTPPAEREAVAFPTPAPRYDSSATKGKGRAVDPREPTANKLRRSPSPSPQAAQDEMPKLLAARAAGPLASQTQLEQDAEEDLPAPHFEGDPTPRLSQRSPVGSANLILRNFRDIPLDTAQLAPANGLVFPADMDLTFTREQMGKEGYTMVGKGGPKDGPFTLAHHWLAFKMDKNLCGINGRLAAPGEPLVIISSKERLDEIANAVSRSHRPDKPYEGVNVFVSRIDTVWLYCGRYRIVHDGRLDEHAQPLPVGPSANQMWPPLLRRAFRRHASDNKDTKTLPPWRQRVLRDWNFETAYDLVSADQELKAAQPSERPQRVMRYLVLACDGVDEESLAVWKANKLSGKRKAVEDGDKAAKKKRSAPAEDDYRLRRRWRR